MANLSKIIRQRHFIIIAIAVFIFVFVLTKTTWAFDISKGIVGNLPDSCKIKGDCSFCDFIDLFVILQKVILSLFGSLALIMLIWGGQGIIMSGGNTQKVADSKRLITSTLLGVVIILVGYFLIIILVKILANPTSESGITSWTNWTTAFCKTATESDFCKERSPGTACGDGSRGKCKDFQCVSSCEVDHINDGYACRDIADCKDGTIEKYKCLSKSASEVCCLKK